jgi:hypothetical protein
MQPFVDNTMKIIAGSYKLKPKKYDYNYFNYYQKEFSEMDKDTKNKYINIIDKNKEILDRKIILDIANFLSYDISNEKSIPNSENINSYILFCLYTYIIELKVDTNYINEENKLILFGKNRPHSYLGKIFDHTNKYSCDVYGIYCGDLDVFKKNKTVYNKFLENKIIMPYYNTFGNIIVYEKLEPLYPNIDPLITVLKDLVNQLKSINKLFWFEYFDKNSLGRSNVGLRRYFISFYDGLIGKEEKLTSHNTYDGRKTYTTLSSKDQIRTTINILSEIYITGGDSYIEKTKLEPFKTYLDVLDSFDSSTVYEDFVLYLMGIKR